MKLIAIMLVGLALVACTEEGYKGLPPLINGTSVGGGIHYTDGSPKDGKWEYTASKAKDGSIDRVTAEIHANNTYIHPNYDNLQQRPWVELQKYVSTNGSIVKTVGIFVGSDVACTPSCKININFDNRIIEYSMRETALGVIRPLNDSDTATIFNKFTSSNYATIHLPILGLNKPFAAEFNLRGYDAKKMKLSIESGTNGSVVSTQTTSYSNDIKASSLCDSMVKQTCAKMSSCVEAEQQLQCGNSELDGDGDGVPCNSVGYVCYKNAI